MIRAFLGVLQDSSRGAWQSLLMMLIVPFPFRDRTHVTVLKTKEVKDTTHSKLKGRTSEKPQPILPAQTDSLPKLYTHDFTCIYKIMNSWDTSTPILHLAQKSSRQINGVSIQFFTWLQTISRWNRILKFKYFFR